MHLWPTAPCLLPAVTLFSPRSSLSTGCTDAPFREGLHAIISWMKMFCFDSCVDSYSIFLHMPSLEVANGPLVTFSICCFEHPFHRLIRSQSDAAVMEEKSLKNFNGSEKMEMHFWTAISRCRGCLCLAVAQSTFCTFGDGRAVVFRQSRINRLVPHHDVSSGP